MWKITRIFILLVLLAVVVRQTFLDKADLDWKDNFYVALYPVNADGSQQVTNYIRTLTKDDFIEIEEYFTEQGRRYNLGMRQPVAIELGEIVDVVPHAPPQSGNRFEVLVWSIRFRWFAWKNSTEVPVKPDIRLYLLYYNPETSPTLLHSTALDKGRIGRVNLFGDATYSRQNLVVVAHELLHTLTATDKYDLSTGLPLYPDGYAEPDKQPRYPQAFAELMGGYVPINETKNEIPKNLDQTLIGEKTAHEIGWLK